MAAMHSVIFQASSTCKPIAGSGMVTRSLAAHELLGSFYICYILAISNLDSDRSEAVILPPRIAQRPASRQEVMLLSLNILETPHRRMPRLTAALLRVV